MSDDRIINFNDLKNKVKDSDVDKFEQYVYNLYILLLIFLTLLLRFFYTY